MDALDRPRKRRRHLVRRSALQKLPNEILQMIARHLEADRDVCNFSETCRINNAAIVAEPWSFWHIRFHDVFDLPSRPANPEVDFNHLLYIRYQTQRRVLRTGSDFAGKDKAASKEVKCIKNLRQMIIESYGASRQVPGTVVVSKNIGHIERFCNSFNVLRTVFQDLKMANAYKQHKRLYYVIVLVLSHRMLTVPSLLCANPTYRFEMSRQIAYACVDDRPIFPIGGRHQIDMSWLLHVVNFWKYHITQQSEGTLFEIFRNLSEDERPRVWQAKLRQCAGKLGGRWKGCYSYLTPSELLRVRGDEGDGVITIDQLNDDDDAEGRQEIHVAYPEGDSTIWWPPTFAREFASLDGPGLPDIPAKHFRTEWMKHGQLHSESSGRLEALPDQEEVPGWQRMTMIRYMTTHDGWCTDFGLWAYEGIVLPGNQIIVGRWWSAGGRTDKHQYSGPFLMWNVDDNVSLADDDIEVGIESE